MPRPVKNRQIEEFTYLLTWLGTAVSKTAQINSRFNENSKLARETYALQDGKVKTLDSTRSILRYWSVRDNFLFNAAKVAFMHASNTDSLYITLTNL